MSYDKGKIEVKSSGSIPGTLKDTFCIDEYKDYIRLVSSREDKNALYVLNMNLETVGSISDIAPGEMKEFQKTVIDNMEYCPGFSEYKAIFADPDLGLLGIAMGTYNLREEKTDSCYKVFQYQPEEGFQEILSVSLKEGLGEADPYVDIDRARGLYIGTVFYLSRDQGIQAYDMEKEYQNIGTLLY